MVGRVRVRVYGAAVVVVVVATVDFSMSLLGHGVVAGLPFGGKSTNFPSLICMYQPQPVGDA